MLKLPPKTLKPRAVLGALMIDPAAIIKVADFLFQLIFTNLFIKNLRSCY